MRNHSDAQGLNILNCGDLHGQSFAYSLPISDKIKFKLSHPSFELKLKLNKAKTHESDPSNPRNPNRSSLQSGLPICRSGIAVYWSRALLGGLDSVLISVIY